MSRFWSLGLLTAVLIGTGFISGSVAEAAPSTTIIMTIDQPEATVNGGAVTLDSAPVIPAGESRTYVPVRFIGETLGAYIGWDDSERKVTYLTGDRKIELWIGKQEAKVDGTTVTLDAAPFITEAGRTMVPARFVSEQFGARVGWNGETRTVTIDAPWVGRVVTMKNSQYTTASLEVEAGARVTWVNLDAVVHNVVDEGYNWYSDLLAQGKVYTRTFEAPGTYRYLCTLHPGMKAEIVVR